MKCGGNKLNRFEEYILDLEKLLEEIIEKNNLPTKGLFLRNNSGENIVSYSVCVNEPSYPIKSQDIGRIFTETSLMKVYLPTTKTKNQGCVMMDVKASVFEDVTPLVETDAKKKASQSNSEIYQVAIPLDCENLIQYTNVLIERYLKTYHTKEKMFGCCSRFIDCSDAKECVHPNKFYATACMYKRHLDNGEIFYGKNANVSIN